MMVYISKIVEKEKKNLGTRNVIKFNIGKFSHTEFS